MRIDITTHGEETKRFLDTVDGMIYDDDAGVPSPCGAGVDPGVQWAVMHPEEAFEYARRRATWWQFIKAVVKGNW